MDHNFNENPMQNTTSLTATAMASFDNRDNDPAAARDRALPALHTIATAIRRNPGTGQGRRLTAFLGGLFNGERFAFDLTDLRALDTELADACLAVLNYDRYRQVEIHHWGAFDKEELNQWLQQAGHYYAAQRRRIGGELYRKKFGPNGHADEGLTG